MRFFNFSSKSRIGIDIGTASIKIAELSKDGGRFKLKNYGLFELESIDEALSVNKNSPSSRVAQLTDRDLAWGIREILKRGKITAKDAVASIPSFSTFATIITMPYISEKDMAKTISFEARKYIPLPMDEVVLDWSIINVSSNSQGSPLNIQTGTSKPPTVEVFLVAVPKQETERYRDIMKNAGVNLRALELENAALIRALVGNDLGPIAIVSIGGRSTSILVVDGGVERVSHNYEVGGFEITKSISRSLNISLKRAEELKRSFGIKQANNNVIHQAMTSLVDMMAFETKKTIHVYEESKKTKINRVLLVGGLANMPSFGDYFGARLGIPLAIGNPLARIVLDPGLDPIRGELNSTFAIALGLAMREV
ncbi:MAG TPA: type IV pilus assembly protein PilM [Candidatus Paceibacterota bacterium]